MGSENENLLIGLVRKMNTLLNEVLATSRVPFETKRSLNAQRFENRMALKKLAKEHNLCPGCFDRTLPEGKELCAECENWNVES